LIDYGAIVYRFIFQKSHKDFKAILREFGVVSQNIEILSSGKLAAIVSKERWEMDCSAVKDLSERFCLVHDFRESLHAKRHIAVTTS
jgi:hypothetical protein